MAKLVAKVQLGLIARDQRKCPRVDARHVGRPGREAAQALVVGAGGLDLARPGAGEALEQALPVSGRQRRHGRFLDDGAVGIAGVRGLAEAGGDVPIDVAHIVPEFVTHDLVELQPLDRSSRQQAHAGWLAAALGGEGPVGAAEVGRQYESDASGR